MMGITIQAATGPSDSRCAINLNGFSKYTPGLACVCVRAARLTLEGQEHSITITSDIAAGRGLCFNVNKGASTSGGEPIYQCPLSQAIDARRTTQTFKWVAPPAGTGPVTVSITCACYMCRPSLYNSMVLQEGEFGAGQLDVM